MKNYINIVLGAKGGIGKTVITTYLAEFLMVKKRQKITVIDTDTNNGTLIKYPFFMSRFIDFKDETGAITALSIQEQIAEEYSNANAIIDTGANSYYAWFSYLKDMMGVQMLQIKGAKVLIHVPIVPGQMQTECFNCLKEIVNADLGAEIVVHLNNGFNSFGQGIKNERLPNAIEIVNMPMWAPFAGKIKYIVEEPRIQITMKHTYDSIRNQYITLSEIADSSLDNLKNYSMLGEDNIPTRKASACDKLMCQKIRSDIFNNYKVLDPLYDIK